MVLKSTEDDVVDGAECSHHEEEVAEEAKIERKIFLRKNK